MRSWTTPQDAADWLRAGSTDRAAGVNPGRTPVLQTDSRALQGGDVFLAYAGHTVDARGLVAQALRDGASACLVDLQGEDPMNAACVERIFLGLSPKDAQALAEDPRVAFMPHLKASRGLVAAHYAGLPSTQIKVLAVTGTNGKTTCTWWLAQALERLGERCAVAGTLGFGALARNANDSGASLGHQLQPLTSESAPLPKSQSQLTTMEAHELQQAMRLAVNAGFTHLALEASSIGLKEGRLTGTQIEVAVLTNLTQDHLDYHGDMVSYWQAKKILFTQMQPKAVVINLDDAHGLALYLEWVLALQSPLDQPNQLNQLNQPKQPYPTIVAYTSDAALLPAVSQALTQRGLQVATAEKLLQEVVCAHHIEHVGKLGAWGFELAWRGERASFELHVLGRYNVSNALAVISTLLALGVHWPDALAACEGLQAVNGRMQRLGLEGTPNVVVDYAHTPDALTQVLSSLKEITRPQGAKLWCVMGCGGDRDRSKRALMGQAAQRWADQVVLTSDNPRSENPVSIMDDIERGMSGAAVERQPDRRRAIEWAVSSAALQDWVLVAGKGHETTQEVAGVRLAFSDADVVAQVLVQERAHRQAARGGRHA